MDMGLEGRVAVVAAASAGLGRATAEGLAAEGCRVAMSSRSEERINAAAREITERTGAETLPIVADVSRAEDVERFVSAAVDRWGRLDVLVTNAGGPRPGTFEELGEDDWLRAFDLTLMSVQRLISAVLPHMRERRWGRIINLTSASVKAPIPALTLSNSLRVAVVGLAKTLSVEVARDNITVNNIAPGRIDTARIRQLDEDRARRQGTSPEQVRRSNAEEIPMGRYGTPEELAALAVFLASERASYITGTTIQVDGGALGNLM